MVGGASTANVTIQLASNASGIPNRFSVSQIDLINDGTGYTVPPLIGISTAPSGFTNATAVAIMTSRGQVGSSIDRIEITNPVMDILHHQQLRLEVRMHLVRVVLRLL